jgi:Short C-terminal domain
MKRPSRLRSPFHALRGAWVGLALAAGLCSPPARAGLLDGLFGTSAAPATAEPGRREWTLRDFTSVRLVPREAGASPNEHPQQVNPDGLRQALAQVQVNLPGGAEPLFAGDELADLVEPLAQALAAARPQDDLLLLSSSRRGKGLFVPPMAITARLFFQGGALNLVVADARRDFYNQYIGSRQAPEFTYGSRAQAGRALLRSSLGSSPRADWLVLPSGATAAVAAPPPPPIVAAPTVPGVAAPAAPPPPAAAAPRPASPAVAAAAAAPRAREILSGDEAESRLTTLKRLRERGLITEDEYQQKRKDILSQL